MVLDTLTARLRPSIEDYATTTVDKVNIDELWLQSKPAAWGDLSGWGSSYVGKGIMSSPVLQPMVEGHKNSSTPFSRVSILNYIPAVGGPFPLLLRITEIPVSNAEPFKTDTSTTTIHRKFLGYVYCNSRKIYTFLDGPFLDLFYDGRQDGGDPRLALIPYYPTPSERGKHCTFTFKSFYDPSNLLYDMSLEFL